MNKSLLSKRFWLILKYVLVSFFLIITVYPILWMVMGSLKTETEFFTNIWGIPKSFQFVNYLTAWEKANLAPKFMNSVLTTGAFLLLLIPINCCAGYALARIDFKRRNLVFMYLMFGIMLPAGVLALPTFTIINDLHLLDTRLGLVLVYVGQAISFGTFIMRSFFIALPKSLEEAAMMDGCTRFRAFRTIIIPLAIPGITTQVIFSGLANWNEYLRANLIIRSPELQTLPLAMASFANQDTINYPVMYGALVLATLPVVIVYLLAQKTFIKGVTAGSVKG